MTGTDNQPYGNRDDPAVPTSADDRAHIVFDGHCNFRSAWARFVIGNDKDGRVRPLAAQSALGAALYRDFGLAPKRNDTNLLLIDARAVTKSAGTLRAFELLDGPWPVFAIFRVIPRPGRDWIYDRVARNRYRLLGRQTQGFLPPSEIRERFLS